MGHYYLFYKALRHVSMRQQAQTTTPNIVKEIQGGKVRPVYLLCGEEQFLVETTLKQMLENLLSPETPRF